jgi:hypothetical protein
MAVRALDCSYFEGLNVVGHEAKESLRQDDGYSGVHRIANETNKKAIKRCGIAIRSCRIRCRRLNLQQQECEWQDQPEHHDTEWWR